MIKQPTVLVKSAEGHYEKNKTKSLMQIYFLIAAGFLVFMIAIPTIAARRSPHLSSQSGAKTFLVSAGENLQAALDQATPGDTILLEAGATFTGNFVLPRKDNTSQNWITIRSSAAEADLPGSNERITPDSANLLPKLVSPNSEAALRTSAKAQFYRLIGIEITIAPEVNLNYGIVKLGAGDETTVAELPANITLDRCYIHGHSLADVMRGVALNSANSAVINSYISECHGIGFDTQAIAVWNSPGPLQIINNYLEGAGENVMFGGADPKVPDLVPSDIEIRRNHLAKPLSWKKNDPAYAGQPWSVKNLLELKNARRVVVEGNLLEDNWVDAQNGFAVLFTVRNQEGGAPWSVVEDVRFANNIVRHVAAAINILGQDNNQPSGQAKAIRIVNNLFEDINGEKWGGGNGNFLTTTQITNLTVDHNTVLQSGNIISAYGVLSKKIVFTNNILLHNAYGIIGDGTSTGLDTLAAYFSIKKFNNNAFVGGKPFLYPGLNFFLFDIEEIGFANPTAGAYELLSGSPLKGQGADGKDVGCDMTELRQALGFN